LTTWQEFRDELLAVLDRHDDDAEAKRLAAIVRGGRIFVWDLDNVICTFMGCGCFVDHEGDCG